jgi:hypothetical protein
MGKYSKRERKSARRAPEKRREQKKRLLVLCEGIKTEPQYIRGYERHAKRTSVAVVDVEFYKESESAVPLTLVKDARERKKLSEKRARKDPYEGYDEIWCVFDRDEHPHVPEALNMARDNDIHVAYSNPCFELWLLLHFVESPGAQHRHELQRRMRDHVSAYEKSVVFEDYSPGLDAAMQRAARLEAHAADDDDSGRNPSTGVFRLIQSIGYKL